ncbi:uncharacterized protein N0V89_011159 [Didymosphaeria variabile]|uniref:Uncharacterized protein n=1 Tax=Didymosphaeria variabile TaxID=1932322 RepID=A0A9W8XCN2_9PLEO|nr:uncharacterized protein N0V89_011159 [Didymosphaeria variabile]KAJ4347220.1 hypothetical protein N0V89_011159 [Didymosphaeria variabile]
MDSSLRMTVLLTMQARRASDAGKTIKTSENLAPVRLDRLPSEIILIILSHLLDHDKLFAKTCIKYARIAHVKKSVFLIPDETMSLRNSAILCRSIMPAAQELLLHTICIDDQKRGPSNPTSIFSMMGRIYNQHPSGLLPFSQSKLFRLIRLLINTPHLRKHVKQLHISLPACRYSNGQHAAVNKLEDEVVSALEPEVDGSARTGALVPAKAQFLGFGPLKTLLGQWKSRGESDVAMSHEQLCVWLKTLLVLLPNLQSLRLWDIHSYSAESESWADLRRKTEPLPRIIRTCLSSSLIAFEKLCYISIPVYQASGVLILLDLPNVKTAELTILRGRASPEIRQSTEIIKHVENLRFPFVDMGSDPDEFVHAMASLLVLFENVRSIEVYDGVDHDQHRRFYNPWLLEIFSTLTPALTPLCETLQTLRYAGYFSYAEEYYCSFPDLSAFHQLKTLDIPQQLIFGRDRDSMDPPSISGPRWTSSRLRIDHLPPNIESMTLDRCDGVILKYLKALVNNEDKFPVLHQVDVIFNCQQGMEMLASLLDKDGKGVEGSRIKFRPIKDYWENTGLAALLATLAASAEA